MPTENLIRPAQLAFFKPHKDTPAIVPLTRSGRFRCPFWRPSSGSSAASSTLETDYLDRVSTPILGVKFPWTSTPGPLNHYSPEPIPLRYSRLCWGRGAARIAGPLQQWKGAEPWRFRDKVVVDSTGRRGRCTRRPVQTVTRSARFPSSPAEIVQSTARSASRSTRVAAVNRAPLRSGWVEGLRDSQ